MPSATKRPSARASSWSTVFSSDGGCRLLRISSNFIAGVTSVLPELVIDSVQARGRMKTRRCTPASSAGGQRSAASRSPCVGVVVAGRIQIAPGREPHRRLSRGVEVDDAQQHPIEVRVAGTPEFLLRGAVRAPSRAPSIAGF